MGSDQFKYHFRRADYAVMNVALFRKNFNNDAELMAKVIDHFLKLEPQAFEEIKKALTERNANFLRICSHKLRGSISSFYCSDLEETLLVLERQAKQEDFSSAFDSFAKLKGQLDQLRKDLSDLRLREAS